MVNASAGHLIPPKRLPNSIDDRAAVFLCDLPSGADIIEPDTLLNRLEVNSESPLEFSNDFFVGRVLILHREPANSATSSRYRSYFADRRRRWELRWQGKFKQPLEGPIVFGGEIAAAETPKLNFASRAFVSLLLRFSQSLARNRGSDMFSNRVSEGDDETVYFNFPVQSSDMILATPSDKSPPDLTSLVDLLPTADHTKCNDEFRTPSSIDIDKTYTFVFYSMYVDFVSWDIHNVPIGLNGMSLNRIVGNQPLSVVMRQGNTEYFRLLLANRCTSPDWSSFLTGAKKGSMTEFFSVISSMGSGDHRMTTVPAARRTGAAWWFLRGIKRVFLTPTRYLGPCLRAPVSFVIDAADRRKTPRTTRRRVVVRLPPPTPPAPDSVSQFVTPISEHE